MEGYLDEINHRLAAIVIEGNPLTPTEAIDPKDKIFGVISEHSQKMFLLWTEFANERDKSIRDTIFGKPGKDIEKKDLCLLTAITEACFWSSVHKEMPETESFDNDDLGIMEGFNVVEKEQTPERALENLFKEFQSAGMGYGSIVIIGPAMKE